MLLKGIWDDLNTNQRMNVLAALGQPIVAQLAKTAQLRVQERLAAIDSTQSDETVAREFRDVRVQLLVYQELEQFAKFLCSKEAKADKQD